MKVFFTGFRIAVYLCVCAGYAFAHRSADFVVNKLRELALDPGPLGPRPSHCQ